MAKGISINIGLNELDPRHYGNTEFRRLEGCIKDARTMKSIANNFEVKLLDDKPTAQQVIDHITEAALDPTKKLVAGDTLVITFSGHGTQVIDISGDETGPNIIRYDQFWCLFDRKLCDDELARLWTLFDVGVRILFISDSCHSGTVAELFDKKKLKTMYSDNLPTNTEIGKTKSLPQWLADKVFWKNYEKVYEPIINGLKKDLAKQGAKNFRQLIKASVISITACQDNEKAKDGIDNGVFTASLKEIWDKGVSDKTYQDFFDLVKQETTRRNPEQHPNILRLGTINNDFENGPPFNM